MKNHEILWEKFNKKCAKPAQWQLKHFVDKNQRPKSVEKNTFMDRMMQYYQDVNFPQINQYRFNIIPIKVIAGSFKELDIVTLWLKWKCKGVRGSKHIWKIRIQ